MRFIPKNQQQSNYQGSIILFHGKTILKKKYLKASIGNLAPLKVYYCLS